MAYAPVAPDFERLPWLNDDIKPAPRDDLRPLLVWSLVAALLIAAASYWLGMTNSPFSAPRSAAADAASATVSLPEPFSPTPLVANVEPAPTPQVELAPVREVAIAEPRSERSVRRLASRRGVLKRTALPDDNLRDVVGKQQQPEAQEAQEASGEKAAAESPELPAKAEPQRLWPAEQSEGASGRVVRIGTFNSKLQAKRAWHRVVRAYPGMRRLDATVVSNPSRRNGRTYYRLQFGTTSQAHSTVLCQWMRNIGQSCVVIGLPGGVA